MWLLKRNIHSIYSFDLIDSWKKYYDKHSYSAAVLMDLFNHDLLLTKLHAYGIKVDSLNLLMSYLSNRHQGTKGDNYQLMFPRDLYYVHFFPTYILMI